MRRFYDETGGHSPGQHFIDTNCMRSTSFLQAFGPLVIVAAGAVAFAWLSSLRTPPDTQPPTTRPPPVRTLTLEPPRNTFDIHVGGQVVPRRVVTLAAEVAGRVVIRPDNIETGRHIAKGTLLLQLDPGDYELAIQATQLEVRAVDIEIDRLNTETAGIVALVNLATKDLELAAEQLDRIELLLEKATATRADRDQAKRIELAARNSLQTLKNQHDLAPVRHRQLRARRDRLVTELAQGERDLQRTRIRAPLEGLLTLANAEVGDFVQTGDVVLKIEETSTVEVECQLGADDLHWLRDSMNTADATPDAPLRVASRLELPNNAAVVTYRQASRVHRWTGRLTRFSGQGVDPKTRTVRCRVVIQRAQNDSATPLMRGMYVTVTLTASPRTRLIEIPSEAVRPNRQAWAVVDNTLVIHPLDVVRVLDNSVLVPLENSTLQPGDRLVVSPLPIAYDGMPVRESANPTHSSSTRHSGPSP